VAQALSEQHASELTELESRGKQSRSQRDASSGSEDEASRPRRRQRRSLVDGSDDGDGGGDGADARMPPAALRSKLASAVGFGRPHSPSSAASNGDEEEARRPDAGTTSAPQASRQDMPQRGGKVGSWTEATARNARKNSSGGGGGSRGLPSGPWQPASANEEEAPTPALSTAAAPAAGRQDPVSPGSRVRSWAAAAAEAARERSVGSGGRRGRPLSIWPEAAAGRGDGRLAVSSTSLNGAAAAFPQPPAETPAVGAAQRQRAAAMALSPAARRAACASAAVEADAAGGDGDGDGAASLWQRIAGPVPPPRQPQTRLQPLRRSDHPSPKPRFGPHSTYGGRPRRFALPCGSTAALPLHILRSSPVCTKASLVQTQNANSARMCVLGAAGLPGMHQSVCHWPLRLKFKSQNRQSLDQPSSQS